MLKITPEDGAIIKLTGRLDAEQAPKALDYFSILNESTTIDLKELEYISSAGLGILVDTYKRLDQMGFDLILTNMNQYIRNVFRYTGLDQVFTINDS